MTNREKVKPRAQVETTRSTREVQGADKSVAALPERKSAQKELKAQRELAEVAPIVELVGVFHPAVADVGAVVHVGNENVFDAGVDLGLRLLHGLAGADDDENDARSAGDEPLSVDLLNVLDVDALVHGALENDGGVFGEGIEGFLVVEGKRRNDDADTDLEAAASAPLGIEAIGKFPEEIANGGEDAFLLNADGGVAEAGGEFEGIDTVIVDDAVDVDIADVAFFGELGLHFQESAVEESVGLAPEHSGTHFAGGRADLAREKFFVLEVDIDGSDEFFAVEETADGNFDAIHAALQLEDFNFFGESFFVGLEHADNVLAVFFLANE